MRDHTLVFFLILRCVSVTDEQRVVPSRQGAVQRGADAPIGLGAYHDQPPNPKTGQYGLKRCVLEGVAVVLLDQRLGVAGDQLGHDLPGFTSPRKLLIGVLNPDHRHPVPARALDEAADCRHDRVTFMGPLDGRVLHVDDQECGVRPVLKCGHGLPSTRPCRRSDRLRQRCPVAGPGRSKE